MANWARVFNQDQLGYWLKMWAAEYKTITPSRDFLVTAIEDEMGGVDMFVIKQLRKKED